ncbi:MAG: HAD family hydrolase [Acidimicrobiales bacterium]
MSFAGLDGALIALDVDGTLLRTDRTLAERTIEATRLAREAGAVLTLATGRHYCMVTDLLECLPAVDYCLSLNGAEVMGRAGETLHLVLLDAEVARDAIESIREAVPGAIFGLGLEGETRYEPGLEKVIILGGGPRNLVDDVVPLVVSGPRNVFVFHPDYRDNLEPLRRMCLEAVTPNGFDVVYSGLPMIELSPAGAGKDAALAWLAGQLGIERGRVVAFGDGLNDVEMIRWAGHGVAMGQAPVEVKEVAQVVTETNDTDGVAAWIEAHL